MKDAGSFESGVTEKRTKGTMTNAKNMSIQVIRTLLLRARFILIMQNILYLQYSNDVIIIGNKTCMFRNEVLRPQ